MTMSERDYPFQEQDMMTDTPDGSQNGMDNGEFNGDFHSDEGLELIQQQLRNVYTSGTSDELFLRRNVIEGDVE
jgi:hypothetical protein